VADKEVKIIPKKPVPTMKQKMRAAGVGAGGMAGTMAIGTVIYLIVSKLKRAKPDFSGISATDSRPTSGKSEASVPLTSPYGQVHPLIRRQQLRENPQPLPKSMDF